MPDPIFAAIQRHRELSAGFDAAASISANLPFGPEFEAADEITMERNETLIDCADDLIESEPTTRAGIVALMRYVGGLQEWEEPGSPHWQRAFLTAMAAALERISAQVAS